MQLMALPLVRNSRHPIDLAKQAYGKKTAQVGLSFTPEEWAQHQAICAHLHCDFTGLVQMTLLGIARHFKDETQRPAMVEALQAFLRAMPPGATRKSNVCLQPPVRDGALLPMREHVAQLKLAPFVRWALLYLRPSFEALPTKPVPQIIPVERSTTAPATATPMTGYYEGNES